jgi:hypothetical protein
VQAISASVARSFRELLWIAASAGVGAAIVKFAFPNDFTPERALRAASLLTAAMWFARSPLGSGALRRLLREADHPVNLAVWRIVLFGTVLFLTEPERLVWLAELPPELTWSRSGVGAWFSALAPPASLMPWLVGALMAAAISALVGCYSRTSAALVTILGLLVFTELQLHGKTRWIHHLLWMSALMAMAPCGDALSLDAWRRRRRGRPPALDPAVRYALPIRFTWLMLGVVYFFPGFWKFVYSGFDWFAPENLGNRMLLRVYLKDLAPSPLFHAPPGLVSIGAVAATSFEILFVFLVLFRRLRPLLFLGVIGFHTFTNLLMGIDFRQVLLLAPVLVDWSGLFARLRGRGVAAAQPPRGRWSRREREVVAVGLSLLVLGGIHGALRIRTWPFAHYPLFHGVADAEFNVLELRADLADRSGVEVDFLGILERRLRHSQARALASHAFRVSRNENGGDGPIRALWNVLADDSPDLASAQRVVAVTNRVRLTPQLGQVEQLAEQRRIEFTPRE